jgi:hypothetical protein
MRGLRLLIAAPVLWSEGLRCYNPGAWSLPTIEVGPTGLWEMASLLGGGQDDFLSSPESCRCRPT